MSRLKLLGTPIVRFTATHNHSTAAKRDSAEEMGLLSQSYLVFGAEVMFTHHLWVDVGLHNGYKGRVVVFFYKYA